LGLALLAATGAVADAGASACTRRHARLPLPLELGDQRIEAIHRADVDADGSLDLLLLVRNTLTLPYAELAPEVSHSILRVRFGPGPRFGSERIATGNPISEYLEHVWFYDADFDGDGTLDLLLHLDPRPDEAPSRIELFRGLGGGRFAPNEAFQFPEQWTVSAVGDFDGDGDDDVVTRSTEDGTAFFVLLGDARNPLASWSPTFVGGYSNVRSILGRAGPGLCGKYVNANDLQYGHHQARIRSEGPAMYVCICHGISEKRLTQAVQEGAHSFEQLQACTGVATCCGACETCARQVLDETLDSQARAPQAA
jgi:bacterioferritin-associated ferredoxin